MDCGFPYIKYKENEGPRDWGRSHGEEFREGIKELFEIRKDLMLARNPDLKDELDTLAKIQWEKSRALAPDIVEELQGIVEGSNLTLTDIVILNNYTDFRDIEGHDQGCSTVYGKTGESSYSGQTWDMHSSAKNYVAMVHSPKTTNGEENITFSLVGCVGMAGVNGKGNLIGVNNINTLGAKPGVIWPVLIRKVLQQDSYEKMLDILKNVAPTSGHSYIVGSKEQGSIWEVSPGLVENTGDLNEDGYIFHTNHCLGEKTKKIEFQSGVNSTTHIRYDLLVKKLPNLKSVVDLEKLFKDHENYPKSICSHFESGSQDPSMTCGGIVADHKTSEFSLWRGCEEYDDNFKQSSFKIWEGTISKGS